MPFIPKGTNVETKKTIMIIDDSPLHLRSLKMMLEKYFNVLPANSGEAGLLMLGVRSEPIDLILLDIEMPNMSGFDFMKHLPALAPDKASVPIICVTGMDATQDFVAQTVASGARDYISKPVNQDILEQKIAKILNISFKRKTILVIDDAPVVLEQLRSLLETSYTVIAVNSGEAGLQMIRAKPIDLILLDIEMPNMSGFEFLSMLSSLPDKDSIPVICITGVEATPDFVARTLEAGARDYIAKPVTGTVLEAKIAKIFGAI
jgi:response regulator RpfG family c-di-GMP phosphodiesterase